ncbi:PIN-like domain-containing protein [Agrobacterium tumefaciens]|uniref:PIN-like domain-containing protein n=1 Tax=Agrobacterium tumefaciens TaxID=358 RepID=UPI0027E53521|nr:hypothetical protein [Agrobacterium tumefaciens]
MFDNCTAPLFASTLNGFVSHYGHSAIHIRDVEELPNGRNSSDLEWIEYLQSSNEVWTFISGDGRILKNPAERAALRSAARICASARLSENSSKSGCCYPSLALAGNSSTYRNFGGTFHA